MQIDLPPPVIALKVAAEATGHWVGFDTATQQFPVYGTVQVITAWVILSEASPAAPEMGAVFTWYVMPRQPVRCVSAVVYRAAMTMHTITGGEQVYSDTIEVMPSTAWALVTSDDPGAWLSAWMDDSDAG